MDVVKTIYHAALNLPRPIRRVCYVQLCAWVGWCVLVRIGFDSWLILKQGSRFCFSVQLGWALSCLKKLALTRVKMKQLLQGTRPCLSIA